MEALGEGVLPPPKHPSSSFTVLEWGSPRTWKEWRGGSPMILSLASKYKVQKVQGGGAGASGGMGCQLLSGRKIDLE